MPARTLTVPAVRPSDVAFIDTAMEIRNAPDAVERAYMARELVQCTLPHSDPGDVPAWGRRNGTVSLTVQQGYAVEKATGELKPLGYPYGTVPRLLLYWLVTEVTRTKSRRVFLGDNQSGDNSLAAFMRSIGLDASHGGKKSDFARLKKAADTLFSAKITFADVTETSKAKRSRRTNMDVSSSSELWWTKDKAASEQSTLFQSWVLLGEHFSRPSVLPLSLSICGY